MKDIGVIILAILISLLSLVGILEWEMVFAVFVFVRKSRFFSPSRSDNVAFSYKYFIAVQSSDYIFDPVYQWNRYCTGYILGQRSFKFIVSCISGR